MLDFADVLYFYEFCDCMHGFYDTNNLLLISLIFGVVVCAEILSPKLEVMR